MKHSVLFIHGGGSGAYEADLPIVKNLQYKLGTAYQVQYPQMPQVSEKIYKSWKRAIKAELAALGHQVILVGHSFGGSVLLKTLSEETLEPPLALCILAAPYWGLEDWEVSEFELSKDFAQHLPKIPMFFYHSQDDDVVPLAHLETFRHNLPQATFHVLTGGGHQFEAGLSVVVRDIQGASND